MEACSNVAAVGAEPIAFTDCLNFGNPEHPEVFWTFEKVVEGLSDFARAIDIPCVGGNVSFYNHDEVNDIAVKPSPVIFAAGLLEDVTKAVNSKFKAADEFIILIGDTKSEIGGSEYTKIIHQSNDGQVPKVDFAKAKSVLSKVVKTIQQGLVTASHDISKGGLFVALTEMAMGGELGYSINLNRIPADTNQHDLILFSETHGRFLFTAKEENVDKIITIFAQDEIPATYIGRVTEEKKLSIKDSDNNQLVILPIVEIKETWKNRMENEMEGKV